MSDDASPRYQPEFSPGERLARLEAEIKAISDDAADLQRQLDRRFDYSERIVDEKLSGLRRELGAVNSALKDSVEKAEGAQQRQFNTFVEQNDRKAEVSGQRISALEQGAAAGEGAQRYKAGQVALFATLAAVATVIIYTILVFHP